MFHPTNNQGQYSSSYGMRNGVFHRGVDIAVGVGAKVYAIENGIVQKIDSKCFDGDFACGLGFGNHISIDHQNDIHSNYAHLSKVFVKVGERVKRGDLIGEAGNTGYSFGSHLHFEIRKGGWLSNESLDPMPYLKGDLILPKSQTLYLAKHTPKYIVLGASVALVAYSLLKLKK